MAIGGTGQSYDRTFQRGANAKTTTAQYHCASLVPETTTVDFTIEVTGDTGTYGTPTAASRSAIGIIQNYYDSTTTRADADVRLFGESKAICSASITTGQWCVAYEGISTTTRVGQIAPIGAGDSCGTAKQSITAYRCVLGRALENGSTNTVIDFFLNPQMANALAIGES